ncbi:hypothetical protein GGR56DRAFT_682584 [Xylariaceae sp. FL0804]|nr:hypothetical protein GGR56DRAFT_682584 [Xylariaceae sp. FL0804]
MFDILWTDPNVELVGERKLRKELAGKTKEKDKEKPILNDGRHSISTASSTSSERALTIFTNKARKKHSAPIKATEAPLCLGAIDTTTGARSSIYGVRSQLLNQDETDTSPKTANGAFQPVQFPEVGDTSTSPSSRDSTLSKWTQQSAATTGILAGTSARDSTITTKSENLIQPLGPSSFVTKDTEVTTSPRISETDPDQLVSEVQISAGLTKADTPPLPELPEKGVLTVFEEREPISPKYGLPQTPPPIEARNTAAIPSACNGNESLGNADAWKPPHEWDCTPTRQSTRPLFEERLKASPTSPQPDDCMFPDLIALQREVRMMAAASPELMLANMKAGMGRSSDATVYKELEMAKKRWMFSALHQYGGYAKLAEQASSGPDSPPTSKPLRVLALYETQASASFLAALHPHVSIAHLSPTPISPSLFPNIQPILVPATSTSAGSRSLPPQLYTTVTCLAMPSLFPSTEIPPFLRHINRCLAPGGALHLTLIDPQPVSDSMGPKLRQWLFEKLLINLEQMFRTTYPSGTFPAWLSVGRLRGKGSTITTVTVPAVPEDIVDYEETHEATMVKTELRCLVTRMLWQEVWGSFVQADRWWWEEEDIIEECTAMNTYWQYSHIIAVKES